MPGFGERQNLFGLLNDEFRIRFGADWNPAKWQCRFDAAARAQGELSAPGGGWNQDLRSGTLVNIATGVAGAFVRSGSLVRRIKGLGQTYGQWGRFLVWNTVTRTWEWRATRDGSLPKLDHSVEVRLTEVCGGPALAKAFVALWRFKSSEEPNTDLSRLVSRVSRASSRDVEAERLLLAKVTELALQDNPIAMRFVADTGRAIGSALKCLWKSVGPSMLSSSVVLTGGVGENFGSPVDRAPEIDPLLLAAKKGAGDADGPWLRSRLGLAAELLGAVARR